MRHEAIAAEIKTRLVAALGLRLDPGAIDEDEPLSGGRFQVTSLAAVEILTALEDSFGVQFPDEMLDISLFTSVRRLADAVGSLLHAGDGTTDTGRVG